MKISQLQIDEILDEADHIRIRRHDRIAGVFVASTHERNGDTIDREDGTDVGELINELHTRL